MKCFSAPKFISTAPPHHKINDAAPVGDGVMAGDADADSLAGKQRDLNSDNGEDDGVGATSSKRQLGDAFVEVIGNSLIV